APEDGHEPGDTRGREPDVRREVMVVDPQRAHVLDGLAVQAIAILVGCGEPGGALLPLTLQVVLARILGRPGRCVAVPLGRSDLVSFDEDVVAAGMPGGAGRQVNLE